MTLLTEITADTSITMDIVQAVSAVTFIAGGIWAWFSMKQKHKDNKVVIDTQAKDIIRVEKEAKERIAALEIALIDKITTIEDNSKTFYKHLDAKYDDLKDQASLTNKLIQEMNVSLKVHLSKCEVKHKKD